MKQTFIITLIIFLGSFLSSAQEVVNVYPNYQPVDENMITNIDREMHSVSIDELSPIIPLEVNGLGLQGTVLNEGYDKLAVAQDGADCRYWINRTGRLLGEADAFLEITRIRERISVYDQSIYALLQNATNAIENAAIACEPSIPAWPNWRQKQTFLANQIRELQETIDHKFKRGRVYNEINSTYNSWANDLSISKLNGKVIINTTCATCYFQLGYSTAYAAQAFRQAEEVIRLFNDQEAAKRQISLAVQYLRKTTEVLKTYYEIQQPRGSFLMRCADLGDLDLENRIASLMISSRNIENIAACCDQAQSISLDIQSAMEGFENSRTNGNTYEECRSKYCPECDNSIVLFGEAVDKECQDCLDKNKELIEQCMKGSIADKDIPDCPSFYPNTIAVWNNVSNQYECDCIEGYVWNKSDTECIQPKPDCHSIYPNSVARWNASVNKYDCDCIQGYEWNTNYTECIKPKPDCKAQYPNTVAKWNASTNQYECDCIQGYEWNIFNECIKSVDDTNQDSEVQPPSPPTYSSCPTKNPDPTYMAHSFDTNGNPDDGTYLSCKYYDNGDLLHEQPRINGKYNGLLLYYGYSLDGKEHPISYKTNYKDGHKHGISIHYTWCKNDYKNKSERETRYLNTETLYNMGKKINTKSFPPPCKKK